MWTNQCEGQYSSFANDSVGLLLSCVCLVLWTDFHSFIFTNTHFFNFCSIIDDKTLLRILKLPILVVLDEAYIEFSGLESKMTWVKKFENLIVLRTFSKRAGILFSS